jgi:hypothetical protein
MTSVRTGQAPGFVDAGFQSRLDRHMGDDEPSASGNRLDGHDAEQETRVVARAVARAVQALCPTGWLGDVSAALPTPRPA